MLLFLKLYLAHLIADFILQPNSIAKNKRKISRLALHSLIHLATALVIINIDLTKRLFAIILVLALLHASSDYIKARFTNDEWFAFTADQAVHFLVIVLAAIVLSTDPASNGKEIVRRLVGSEKLYLYSTIYIAVTFGGGYFVQKVTQYFMRQIDPDVAQEKPGLPNAGKYIGWLERSLVLTFIVAGYPDGIGLLLAAKALARYPEIKSDSKGHFAEYFLIGTLTSVTVALIAGFVLLKLKLRIAN
jgi:hypothetical protein